jgi:hypothetical protein
MSEESQEVSTLDFANLIGGPLNAIVEAQAKSAISTANFIKQVGFKLDEEGNVTGVNYVNFQFSRKNEDGRSQDFKLTVPLLTMVPIPYITVVEGNIEFNAKITSVRESKMDSSFKQDVSANVTAGFWFVKTQVNTQTSYQQNTSETGKVERSYDMNVKVKVRNADMPRGTERILDILQEVIEEVPVTPIKAISGTITAFTTNTLTLSTAPPELASGWEMYINDSPSPVGKITNKSGQTVTLDTALPAQLKTGYAFEARRNGAAPAGAQTPVKAPVKAPAASTTTPTKDTKLKTGDTIETFLTTVITSTGKLSTSQAATAALTAVKGDSEDKKNVIDYLNAAQPTGFNDVINELNKA